MGEEIAVGGTRSAFSAGKKFQTGRPRQRVQRRHDFSAAAW